MSDRIPSSPPRNPLGSPRNVVVNHPTSRRNSGSRSSTQPSSPSDVENNGEDHSILSPLPQPLPSSRRDSFSDSGRNPEDFQRYNLEIKELKVPDARTH